MAKDAGKITTLRDVNIVRVKVVKTPGDYEEVEKKFSAIGADIKRVSV